MKDCLWGGLVRDGLGKFWLWQCEAIKTGLLQDVGACPLARIGGGGWLKDKGGGG